MNKIEYEGRGTCARIEISQDAKDADKNVKWFLKVHKTYKLFWVAYFQFNFSQVSTQIHIFKKFFDFRPPENES